MREHCPFPVSVQPVLAIPGMQVHNLAMAWRLLAARFLYSSGAVMSGAGSRFADAGKTVRTGHSGAAVSGHNPATRPAVMSHG
jgi:hypothetical protein